MLGTSFYILFRKENESLLSTVLTNLNYSDAREEELCMSFVNFITRKLSQNQIFRTGSLGFLSHQSAVSRGIDGELDGGQEVQYVTYFCLLDPEGEQKWKENEDQNHSNQNPNNLKLKIAEHDAHSYILCLIVQVPSTDSIEDTDSETQSQSQNKSGRPDIFYFRPEFNEFSTSFSLLLFERSHINLMKTEKNTEEEEVNDNEKSIVGACPKEVVKSAAFRRILDTWFSVVITYISRCVDALSGCLDTVIHCCLLGGVLYVDAPFEEYKELVRFVEKISILNTIVHHYCPEGEKGEEIPAPSPSDLILTFQSTRLYAVNRVESNRFCSFWAKKFLHSCENPILLRSLMERMKMGVLNSLNSIRKMIDQSKNDNYALFRAAVALKSTGNVDVVTSVFASTFKNVDIDTSSILKILSAHLEEIK